jgi:MscS family membrane protein
MINFPTRSKTLFLLLAHILVFLSFTALAQTPASMPTPAAPTSTATPASPTDTLGRDTPKGLIQGFLKALGNQDYTQAATYLDLRNFSASRQKSKGPELAKDLQNLLDQGGRIETASKLSDKPEGDTSDNLPTIDLIGTIRVGKKSVDLLAERHEDPVGIPIWQISRETVADIPDLTEEMGTGHLDQLLPSSLIENKWYGVPVGHWLALFSLAFVALLIAWLLTYVVIYFIRMLWQSSRKGYTHDVLDALIVPIRIYIALGIFVVVAGSSGISIIARQNFLLVAEIVAWLSFWWFLWRIVDIAAEIVQAHMARANRRSTLSSVVFFRRAARMIIAGMAIALALEKMGWNVTGWFAALGIGGLALVFGAQKTLENFVVGLTLIIDQPLRIGDFCKIGDIMGTVEDIGMRSTRLLTLGGTKITVPNGTLATTTIENFALRQRYWFHPILELNNETAAPQLRQLLMKLYMVLGEHKRVDKDSARARLVEITKTSLKIEVFSFMTAESFEDFLQVQEELLLSILETIDGCNIKLLPRVAPPPGG